MKTIKYKKGYKYQLVEDHEIQTPIIGLTITDQWYSLSETGMLFLQSGYAWDGASGPTFDSESSFTPSAEHDAFCQMMRDGRLSYDQWQDIVNEFFRVRCIQCGMYAWRALIWYSGVEFGDAGNPKQGPDGKIFFAPA